jgi:hypothetical protein
MPEITIPYGAESEPDVPIRINGVDHSIRVGVQTTVTDAVYATLQQSFYADDIVVHEDEGGGGDFLDTQTITSAVVVPYPEEDATVITTGYSNGTLLYLAQGAADPGISWLGDQIEALVTDTNTSDRRLALIFAVLGTHPDEGWEKMTINGHEYLRADATYLQNGATYAVWQWVGVDETGIGEQPFETGPGNVVTWE